MFFLFFENKLFKKVNCEILQIFMQKQKLDTQFLAIHLYLSQRYRFYSTLSHWQWQLQTRSAPVVPLWQDLQRGLF